ncbi:MAG: methyltransferase protein [Solirubrobacterales bacterium]|jgi:predicted SAM-dependent methyltransferase|nr:methyltransferase protein [Solirubrobacterales bacterium]
MLGATQPRLHLGCGAHTKPGWVNIDLWRWPAAAPSEPDTTVVNYDLTRGLPLGDDTCTEIYSSHFLEHLWAREGASLLIECHRVLRPGGRLRTCLPDFARVAQAYVSNDDEYFSPLHRIFSDKLGDGVSGSGTILDAVNNVLYQFGEHRCMYDTDKLLRLLSAIGFSKVEASSFDPAIDGDWDAREHFSLYVNAFK